ncbi:hypothetical protein GE21DRAFT_1222741 [Neurospora crassa]|nr:hypothetical protein GE21DRAFT_1222741 [Neurospora crassa]
MQYLEDAVLGSSTVDRYAAPSSLAALEWAHGLRPLVRIFYVTGAYNNGRASSESMGVLIIFIRKGVPFE